MTGRPSRKQQLRRCLPVLLALSLVSGLACTVVVPGESVPAASPPPPPPPRVASEERVSRPLARSVEPGFEPGFVHCCGDFDYVMQVDCSERLLRCYVNESQGWRQTYGRNCKTALGSGCYERGCLSVCDSDH